MTTQFTLYHNGQFCLGILEIESGEMMRDAHYVFGSTRSNPELYQFLLGQGGTLIGQAEAAAAVAASSKTRPANNPKRIARETTRQMCQRGPGKAALDSFKETLARNALAAKSSGCEKRR